MPATLEGRPKDIIAGKNYAHLAIPRQDGTVQTVIVWAHTDDGNVTLNSSEGRTWPENLRKAGTATVTVMADGDPYEWVSVTGRLVEDTHEGADEQINALAKKYIDQDVYPYRVPGEQRVKFALRPERVHYNPPKIGVRAARRRGAGSPPGTRICGGCNRYKLLVAWLERSIRRAEESHGYCRGNC